MHEALSLLDLVFRDDRHRAGLESTIRAVLDHFSLPPKSLCCIFDDQERWELTNAFGESFCGFFYPVAQYGFGQFQWPAALMEHVSDLYHGRPFTCDAAAYLRKSVCEKPTGATITFSHELQHFVQYGFHFKEWRANSWIQHVAIPEMIDPKPWHFPTEYEAQITSKRIAEAVLGHAEIDRYALERIADYDDVEKWTFFRGLDTAETYDFVIETHRMAELYRGKLEALSREHDWRPSDPDFTRPKWWE
jgi:hypothetical protein